MMTQPIFDMHAVAAEEFVTDDSSQGLLDQLMDSLARPPALPTGAALADEMLDRAVSYDDSQPSFAAELRAAVTARPISA